MDIVNSENSYEGDDYKFERAFNFLMEPAEPEQYDEAVGGGGVECINDLQQIFPNCQPAYLMNIIGKHGPNFNFDAVVDELSLRER